MKITAGPFHAHRSQAEAHYRRGKELLDRRSIEAAIAQFAEARAFGFDEEKLAEPLWLCAMLRGDFAAAWKISDQVLRRGQGLSTVHLPHHLRRVWDGTALSGRHVLIRCYHGLGDTLQFIRFAPLVRRLARRVTVEAPPALLPLLESAPGIDFLVPLDTPVPHEIAIESMEVPHALRTTLRTIPAEVPYLAVPAPLMAAARRRLAQHRGLKLGLVWAAGEWDPLRTVPLGELSRLAEVPGAALIALQRGPALQAASEAGAPRFSYISDTDDVLETAALITALDLVVTVDTMVAHLAGALGRPVWTLLHASADWRWMLERDDTPWYPTMRLFRQPVPGAWSFVAELVAAELAALAARTDSPCTR